MKALYLLAPLGLALAGCSVYPPVAVQPAPVVTPPNAVVMGAPAIVDSDRDGHADSVDRYPQDALRY